MSFKWGPEGKCSLAGSDDKGKFELFFELRMDELVLCAIVHEVQDDDNEDELQLKPVCLCSGECRCKATVTETMTEAAAVLQTDPELLTIEQLTDYVMEHWDAEEQLEGDLPGGDMYRSVRDNNDEDEDWAEVTEM